MDILNFISWIKRGDYRPVLPVDATNLIAIGSRDLQRDDDYRPLAINAAPLQSVYNTGDIVQLGGITSDVILDAHNGVITTAIATTPANSTEPLAFKVYNSNVKSTSKILLSCQYSGAANSIPTAMVSQIDGTVGASFFAIKLGNGGSAALNAPVKIHFIILQ